jgi:hypothetical protein
VTLAGWSPILGFRGDGLMAHGCGFVAAARTSYKESSSYAPIGVRSPAPTLTIGVPIINDDHRGDDEVFADPNARRMIYPFPDASPHH